MPFRIWNCHQAVAWFCRRLSFAGKIFKILVPAGQLFGVPIKIHVLWFGCPLGMFLWFGWQYVLTMGGTQDYIWFFEILASLLMLMDCLLLHEFAHVLVARRYGVETKQVIFHPFGVMAAMRQPLRGRADFWTALAGPSISLVLAAFFTVASGHLVRFCGLNCQ